MKALTLVLGAAIAATTSSQLQAMPIQPLSEASPMVVQAADGCGGGRYRGPAARAIGIAAVPIRADIMGPITDHIGPGPGNGCGWYRGPGGACHPLGRGPYSGGYYGPYRY
jgi:hypothetical protein